MDLVTFTEEILTGKLHFLCIVHRRKWRSFFACGNSRDNSEVKCLSLPRDRIPLDMLNAMQQSYDSLHKK